MKLRQRKKGTKNRLLTFSNSLFISFFTFSPQINIYYLKNRMVSAT